MVTTGDLIRLLRQRKNMSQQELGDLLGVQKSAIQKYESGAIKNLKADVIGNLCRIFGVFPYIFIFPDQLKNTIDFPWNLNLSENRLNHLIKILDGVLSLNDEGLEKTVAFLEILKKVDDYTIDGK